MKKEKNLRGGGKKMNETISFVISFFLFIIVASVVVSWWKNRETTQENKKEISSISSIYLNDSERGVRVDKKKYVYFRLPENSSPFVTRNASTILKMKVGSTARRWGIYETPFAGVNYNVFGLKLDESSPNDEEVIFIKKIPYHQ